MKRASCQRQVSCVHAASPQQHRSQRRSYQLSDAPSCFNCRAIKSILHEILSSNGLNVDLALIESPLRLLTVKKRQTSWTIKSRKPINETDRRGLWITFESQELYTTATPSPSGDEPLSCGDTVSLCSWTAAKVDLSLQSNAESSIFNCLVRHRIGLAIH